MLLPNQKKQSLGSSPICNLKNCVVKTGVDVGVENAFCKSTCTYWVKCKENVPKMF